MAQMMRSYTWLVLCTFGVAVFCTLSAAQHPSADLNGVWKASRNFGSEVRGRLTVVQYGGSWQAMIDGRSAPVSVQNKRISFTLPAGEGSFQGVMSKKWHLNRRVLETAANRIHRECVSFATHAEKARPEPVGGECRGA